MTWQHSQFLGCLRHAAALHITIIIMLETNLSRVRLFLSGLRWRCRGGQLLFSNVVLLWRRLKTIISNTRSFKMSLWLWIGEGVPSHGCGAPYKKGKLWLSFFGEIIQTCRSASLQFLALVSSRREPTVLESTLNRIFKERTHKHNVCNQSKNRNYMTRQCLWSVFE